MADRVRSWRTIALTSLCALVTLCAVDAGLHWVAPPKPLLEIDEAVEQVREGDPTVLVLGSSHARSFVVLGRVLAERTGGAERVQPVPVEWGKYTPYLWTLQHRLLPLIDERDARGTLVRPSLKRAVIVTEWWDSTTLDGGNGTITMSLPARAWRWKDFLADLFENNLTPYNQNFLQRVWRDVWPWSVLVQDRGHENIARAIRDALKKPDPSVARQAYDDRIQMWQTMIETGEARICDPEQMAALEQIVAIFKERGLDLTLLLYPRKPGTLTEKAKATTLARFSERMKTFADQHAMRFVDQTWQNPLTDDDFADDFDHILPDGNLRWSEWSLAGGLSFLVGEPRTAGGAR